MLATRRLRQRVVLLAIVLAATLVGAYFTATRLFDTSLQAAVYDFVITSAPAPIRNQIAIVALDDDTVKRYGRWPVPRRAYVDLLRALKDDAPTAIAFDVAFYDPSDRPDDDRAFAGAIRESGNVILAMQGIGAGEYVGGAQRFTDVKLPLDAFREAAASVAAVNILPDPDGRVRDAQMLIRGPDGTTYYNLALVAAGRALRADIAGASRNADGWLVVPAKPVDRVLPLNEGGAMRVYYGAPPHADVRADAPPSAAECGAGEQSRFVVVSALDVIDGKVPAACLRNRVVFVGAHTLPAAADDYPVPNSANAKMWGVEIWANTAQSIFTDRFPVPDQGTARTLLQLLAITAIGVWLIARLRLAGFLLALGGLAAYSALQLFLFIYAAGSRIGAGAVDVPSTGYLLPATFWWVVTLGYLLVEEQLAVARTQSTFGRFVTASVARTILDREERGGLQLGGELRDVTVLFGDIRGFTTMSEGMDPSMLMSTLNRYFEGMVQVVNRYQGTVNKYNGDNIMVIWNAPVEVADHARKAVECAIEMQTWVSAERAKGGPDVSFGFGINSGTVLAGFLGASGRMEYTVIGDAANVASRLTSGDIARRDQVACSAETLSRLGPDVVSVDLGAVLVKGRTEPVRCYQIDRVGAVANPNPAPPPEIPIGKAAVAGFH